ncbi:MAG: Ig-like domain-containing protein, partial [Algoriphagus sp.]|nr:Ig-like domain-containing protein [Algoriphagus sp.]
PINNSTIEQGTQQVVLKTNASTSGLAIQKVEYFNWGFPLVSVNSGNFEFTWQTILVDNYNITAKVTDSKGIVYTTDAVKFSVTAPAVNKAPTVTLSNPTEGQIFTKGVNTVELVANALDPEGKIRQVEFYNGTTLLTTVTAAPYSFNWATIAAGDYQVSAKVIDEGNLNATSAPVRFSVKDQTVAYTALMVSPINNSTIEQGTQQVVLKTNASTSGLAIQKVEYFNWGNLLTTVTGGNFEFTWQTIQVDNYNITAKVTDSKGIVYTTDAVKFSVTAPTNTIIVDYSIKVFQPYDNQIFTLGKEAVIIKADVKSPATIKSIQFFNYGLPLASDSTFPYEFDWKRIKAGDYQVHAVVTDSNGKTATSNLVKFRVNSSSTKLRTLETTNTLTATTSVEIAQPYDNQIFEFGKDSVILQANTSEKVSKVEFFNWHLPLASVTNDQNQFNWSKIEVGDYLVYARITDSLGKSVESEPILFRVIAPEKKPIEKENSTRDLQKDTDGYGIKMGPNPTSSELNIFFDDYPENLEGKVSVIDLRGVELFNSDFNTSQGTITLDLDFLKPGIYLVRLNFGNKIFQSHKLIKN